MARLRFLETDNDKISNIAATVGQYLKKERGSVDKAKMTKLGISEVNINENYLEPTHSYFEEVNTRSKARTEEKRWTY